MIGIFDSGHGGLTVLAELQRRFPARAFIYLGDHAHAPYGDKTGPEILAHTQHAVETLFAQGCKLVLLACNTASASAARSLQQSVVARHPGHRLLGIIAPTVEAATQTPWSITTPQFPQKYNTDTLALFATSATIQSGVYEAEVAKRCPRAKAIGQSCPKLVPLIESGAPEAHIREVVEDYVRTLLSQTSQAPDWAILGCTHYPLVAHLFRQALPPSTRLLNQPRAVADALDDYLERHPEFDPTTAPAPTRYLTTGDPQKVTHVARLLTGQALTFQSA